LASGVQWRWEKRSVLAERDRCQGPQAAVRTVPPKRSTETLRASELPRLREHEIGRKEFLADRYSYNLTLRSVLCEVRTPVSVYRPPAPRWARRAWGIPGMPSGNLFSLQRCGVIPCRDADLRGTPSREL